MSLKSPSGRIASWTLQLQEFNLKICYTPGKSNVIVDMLPRPFSENQSETYEIDHFFSSDLPSKSSKMRESHLKNDHLRQVIKSFESTHKDENFENWTEIVITVLI
ncbi:hypothetical protein AVEN_31407-1 [Araneus ventricosus]|uniref:Reverse transcriptase RNase H-like domain-containing protein n=1 Tax=Araneus ventricosus TaxID=182803 RepID=A0A4Y2EJ97_ARAVE|nr:hypothetical protein AVEN_31407-1 [Araneus ventricosus]